MARSLTQAILNNNQIETDKILMILDSYANISIHLTQEQIDIIKNWDGFSHQHYSYYDYKGHQIITIPKLK